MRTKTLLLTAALSAVGLSTSMAQVFSVNAVGFVTIDVPKGLSMIANPLKAPTNTIAALFASAADGTTVYKYDGTQFSSFTFEFGDWGTGNTETLLPGEGAFIRNPAAASFPITFVGEVSQGSLSHAIAGPNKFSIQSSEVPQSGKLATDLAFPASEGDTVYQFDNAANGYVGHTFEFGDWSNGEPVPKVGESFFVRKVDSKPWARTFNVNTP